MIRQLLSETVCYSCLFAYQSAIGWVLCNITVDEPNCPPRSYSLISMSFCLRFNGICCHQCSVLTDSTHWICIWNWQQHWYEMKTSQSHKIFHSSLNVTIPFPMCLSSTADWLIIEVQQNLFKQTFHSRTLFAPYDEERNPNAILPLTVLLSVYGRWKQAKTIPVAARSKGPATQNAVCRSGLRSLSAAECYILSRLF